MFTCGPGLIAGGSNTPTTTWNPADKAAVIALSNGNLTAAPSGGSGNNLVRATNSKSTGKWYFEIHEDLAGSSIFTLMGLCNSSTPLTNSYPGSDANGWGYYQQTGQSYHSGTASSYGTAWSLGDVIGCAIDFSAGKIFFSRNNTWQNSGNPVTGTNPAYTGVSGTLFPALGCYCPNGGTFTARFKLSALTYTPPTGFSAWG